jgi:nitrite reductase/ring-hydroxylating ferredoxin subunit
LPYVRLCKVDAVPSGELKQFTVQGIEILVINLNSRLYCLDARCTHAGAPLAEGELTGDVLTCPWHGSKFHITDGSVIRGPAENPLRVYPYIVKEDQVFVEL